MTSKYEMLQAITSRNFQDASSAILDKSRHQDATQVMADLRSRCGSTCFPMGLAGPQFSCFRRPPDWNYRRRSAAKMLALFKLRLGFAKSGGHKQRKQNAIIKQLRIAAPTLTVSPRSANIASCLRFLYRVIIRRGIISYDYTRSLAEKHCDSERTNLACFSKLESRA